VRISVSQKQVTVTLCTEELFLSSQYSIYIALPTYLMVNYVGEGGIRTVNTIGRHSWVSHLPARPHCGLQSFSDKTRFIPTIILEPGKTIKPFFLLPAVH
jgi:hypothetical protein